MVCLGSFGAVTLTILCKNNCETFVCVVGMRCCDVLNTQISELIENHDWKKIIQKFEFAGCYCPLKNVEFTIGKWEVFFLLCVWNVCPYNEDWNSKHGIFQTTEI